MSVRIMSVVFSSRLPATDRLIALALADHAHDDGSRVFPSIAALAAKVGMGTTATRKAVRRLEADGVLIRVIEGGGRSRPHEYRFSTGWITSVNATASVGFTAPSEDLNPTPENPKPNASDPKTQRLRPETQRLGVAESLEPSNTEPSGTIKRATRARDAVFELLWFVETGTQYQPGTRIAPNLRQRINAATAQARTGNLTIEDLSEAVTGWSLAMPPGSKITANGLVTNSVRCISAARGAPFSRTEGDVRHEELMRVIDEAWEQGRE